MEDLTLHLGAEQSIRITPHPVVTVRGNTRSIGKSNQTVTSAHVIDIKNTKDSVVAIDVSDQLPLSSDEKIKVGVVPGLGMSTLQSYTRFPPLCHGFLSTCFMYYH